MVPLYGIKFPNQSAEAVRDRLVTGRAFRRIDKHAREWGCYGCKRWDGFENSRVPAQIPVECVQEGLLVIAVGFVARYPGKAEFIEDGRNVFVFELNGTAGPASLGHEGFAVPGFDVWAASEVVRQHLEIVGNDCLEFVILPI